MEIAMFKINILRLARPVEVTFYTANINAHELFPVAKATKYLPKWVSNSKHDRNVASPVNCHGLRAMYQKGIALPLWSDVRIQLIEDSMSEKCAVKFDMANEFRSLTREEGHALDVPRKILMKAFSPWMARTDEDIMFSVMENMFDPKQYPAEFMSGVQTFKYQFSTNFFFYLPNFPMTFQMNAGDVPIIIVPNTERDVVVKSEYNPEMAQRLVERFNRSPFFTNRLGRTMRRVDQISCQ